MEKINEIIKSIDLYLSQNIDYESYIQITSDLDGLKLHIKNLNNKTYLKGIRDCIKELNE